MAFEEATTVLQLVLLITWTCLKDTPAVRKNLLFDQFFTSLIVMEDIVTMKLPLKFASGLFEMLRSTEPPTIGFFKSLPVLPKASTARWGVYLIVLEKLGQRPRIYIGSSTQTLTGMRSRLRQYDDGFLLPVYVESALNDGFTIVHKGLLCWVPVPTAADHPITRLLMLALEASFTFAFWAMRPGANDDNMGHICPWDRKKLEYDGCCSHCCLKEAVHGDFKMTAEELENKAAAHREKRLLSKSEWHFKQMENNYDDYMGRANDRVAKSRANNPGRDKKHQADRVAKALAEDTYRCIRCSISFGTKQSLQDHEKTAKHIRKELEHLNPFKCRFCNLGFHNNSNLTRHNKTERHKKAVASALSSSKLG